MYPMAKPRVYKSNALIDASYRLGVIEQRIILACISQVRRDQPITDEVLYSVSIRDIGNLAGTERKSLYDDLSKAARRLRRKDVTIALEPNGGGIKPMVMEMSWVQTCVYIEREGRIQLRFSKDMLPYLAELKEQFTGYALADVIRMTSAYAIRLFELLIQYSAVGQREIAVEDLRRWFRLEDTYRLLSELRRRVIEPAVSQINEHGPLTVQWEPRKSGRTVTHFVFTFTPKKKTARRDAPIKVLSEYELSKLARPGESHDEALKRLKVRLKK